MYVREDWADELVAERVVAKLSALIRDGGYQAEEPGKLAEAMARRKTREAYWDEMVAFYKNEQDDAEATKQAERDKKAELAKIDAEVQAARIPLVIRGYWDTDGDQALVAARWAGRDVSARRRDLKALATVTVARSPLTRVQALRFTGEERRQVARGQVHVAWREDYRQDSDGAHGADGGERVTAIPENPDPVTWGIPAEGRKWCSGECRQMLPADLEHFYKAPDTERTRPTADGLMNVCKTCHKARVRRRKAEKRQREAEAERVVSGEEVSTT